MTILTLTRLTILVCHTASITSKVKRSLMRTLVGYRNWRQRWSKRRGTRFEKRVMRQKFYFLVLLHLHVLNIGFLSHYPFLKPCSPPFYSTFASNSYIPPTFSSENFFLYLFPLFFFLILASATPPPPPRFNYRHEQTPAFVWDHCTERWRILTRRLDFEGIPLVV